MVGCYLTEETREDRCLLVLCCFLIDVRQPKLRPSKSEGVTVCWVAVFWRGYQLNDLDVSTRQEEEIYLVGAVIPDCARLSSEKPL